MLKVAMLSTLRVKDVMTEALVLLRSEAALDDAWNELHRLGVSGAPVLDPKGKLVGLISLADFADPRRRPAVSGGTVGDVMTRVVYAVRASDAVVAAVRLMEQESIHRVLVVNDDGSLAGMVVPMDILRALALGEPHSVEYFDLRLLANQV